MLVAPLPKFQAQAVGTPVDVSVKVTIRGAVPDSLLELKEDTGGGGSGSEAVTVLVLEDEPLALVAVKVMVYVPGVSYVTVVFC